MKYLVCETQAGEGCDHTIGCGMRHYEKDADSIKELKESLIWPDGGRCYSSLEGDMELCEILIIPFDQVTKVDVDKEKMVVYNIREREKTYKDESDEKAEYERLRQKFERC